LTRPPLVLAMSGVDAEMAITDYGSVHLLHQFLNFCTPDNSLLSTFTTFVHEHIFI